MPRIPDLCRCGHPQDLHTHLRDGDDCGRCGKPTCPGYRPPNRWRRYLLRLRTAEEQNHQLWAEVRRLRASERKLRNMIALHRFNGPAA